MGVREGSNASDGVDTPGGEDSPDGAARGARGSKGSGSNRSAVRGSGAAKRKESSKGLDSSEATAPVNLTVRILTALALSSAILTIAGVLYAVAPEPTDEPHLILLALICLILYVVLLAWSIRVIGRTRHPVIHGFTFLTLLTSYFVLVLATFYRVLESGYPGSFSEELSHTSALYFSVTVLTTVGFGDITPVTDVARGIVTAQMVLGLMLISVAAQLISRSVRIAQENTSRERRRERLQERRARRAWRTRSLGRDTLRRGASSDPD